MENQFYVSPARHNTPEPLNIKDISQTLYDPPPPHDWKGLLGI